MPESIQGSRAAAAVWERGGDHWDPMENMTWHSHQREEAFCQCGLVGQVEFWQGETGSREGMFQQRKQHSGDRRTLMLEGLKWARGCLIVFRKAKNGPVCLVGEWWVISWKSRLDLVQWNTSTWCQCPTYTPLGLILYRSLPAPAALWGLPLVTHPAHTHSRQKVHPSLTPAAISHDRLEFVCKYLCSLPLWVILMLRRMFGHYFPEVPPLWTAFPSLSHFPISYWCLQR